MSSLTIGRFLARLDGIISGYKAAEWDVNGLQLGDASVPAVRVAVCHEVTEPVVAALEAAPVDLVVAYHPLLFRPTTRITAGRSPAGRAYRLLRAGISVAVAHTAYDAAEGGTADSLAAVLGLGEVSGFGHVVPGGQKKVVTFVPSDAVERVASAMAVAGAGRIGSYSGCSFRTEGTGAFFPEPGSDPYSGTVGEPAREPEVRLEMICDEAALDSVVSALAGAHPYEEAAFDVYDVHSNLGFVGRVGRVESQPLSAVVDGIRDVLDPPGLRVSGEPSLPVSRVAVVPGSGGSFVAEAAASGADVLVTGDVGHHTVVSALDRGMAVVDVGHASGERPGVSALAERIGQLTDVVVDMTGFDPTPWR